MTASEFKNELKNPSGVYLFYGEEEYLKRYYLGKLREAVVPDMSLAAFNHTILHGEEGVNRFASACDMLPVMAEKKLIELHSVKYSASKKEESQSENTFTDEFVNILSGVDEDTVVVLYTLPYEFDPGYGAKKSSVYNKLAKAAKPVEFSRQPPAKLSAWIAKHFARAKIEAAEADCLFMVDYCSQDMFCLSNETEKLIAYLSENSRDKLTRGDIIKVCSHTDDIEAFDFSNALLADDKVRAFEILSDMEKKKQKPEMILGSISSVYCSLLRVRVFSDSGMNTADMAKVMGWNTGRVNVYIRYAKKYPANYIERAVNACHDADLKMKTTPSPKYGILAALVSGGI